MSKPPELPKTPPEAPNAKRGKTAETPARPRLGLTIGTKLITMIAALLMGTAALLLYVFTARFTENSVGLVKELSNTTASSIASMSRAYILSTIERARSIGNILIQAAPGQDATVVKQHLVSQYFDGNSALLAVFIHKKEGTAPVSVADRVVSPELSQLGDAPGDSLLTGLTQERTFSLERVMQNEDQQVATVALSDGSRAIAISVPLMKFDHNGTQTVYTATAFIKQSHLNNLMADYPQTTNFIVDDQGRLLAHSEADRAIARENVSHLQIVKDLLAGKSANEETEYEGVERGEKVTFLGAFHTIGFARLGAVSQSPRDLATSNVKKVVQIAQGIAISVLFIAFMSGYLYSGTITRPIRNLVEASEKISQGDFQIDLKATGRDEMAHLSSAFNQMAKGLEERDRVKEAFHKFHSTEIAERLLSGEVKLGGERRIATVLFSDVRGFTAMSEAMEPEAVVDMLNEYLTRMVSIIHAHQGVVDKYVGDAIMALWGVPISTPNDAENAVRASIAMRQELALLNEVRIARGQHALRIGIGLNSGPLIAGNIGSTEKMEYTVIGDAVNVASRIESMTKEYGTDLLVSRNVLDQVGDKFVTEPCKSMKVKGKSAAIEILKVRGFYDESGTPVLVETPYSSFAPEKSDKSQMAMGEAAGSEEPVKSESPQVQETLLPYQNLSEGTGVLDLTNPNLRIATDASPPPRVVPPPFKKAS